MWLRLGLIFRHYIVVYLGDTFVISKYHFEEFKLFLRDFFKITKVFPMEKNPLDYERHEPVYSAQFVQKPADLAMFLSTNLQCVNC